MKTFEELMELKIESNIKAGFSVSQIYNLLLHELKECVNQVKYLKENNELIHAMETKKRAVEVEFQIEYMREKYKNEI